VKKRQRQKKAEKSGKKLAFKGSFGRMK
jgi:hypothetical protein